MEKSEKIRLAQADRLRMARSSAGFDSATDAIRRFGWTQSTYLANENGQNGIKPERAREYARAFKVSASWILTGEGSGPHQAEAEVRVRTRPNPSQREEFQRSLPSEEYLKIGRFDARYSAGPGSILESNPEPSGYILAETQWLRKVTRSGPDSLAVVRVDGDSMFPTLQSGDWVLIDRTEQRIAREGIYCLQVQDSAWIKRLSLNLKDRLVRIISDNPTVPMQEIQESELTVVGRVVALIARPIP